MRIRGLKRVAVVAVIAGAAVYLRLKPRPVEAHTVDRGELVVEVMGTGTLEARVKTTVSPRIQERLDAVLVDQGDPVHAGQLVARLDDTDIRAQIDVATASLAAARASVERVSSDAARAAAVVTTAQLNYRRAAELLARQMISQENMDKSIESLRTAEADVQRVQAAIAEAQAQVVTAEKTLAYHRQRLEYTQITSPYDGLVVRRDRDPGGVVVPGGSLLLVIATNELWVSAWVNETAAAALRTGQTARVVFRSDVRDAAGSVVRLGRETDRETREFVVDVRVEELPPNWTIGQRAEVYIETGREADAVRVPPGFVAWRGRAPGVFVEEGGAARWRAVELGRLGRGHAEVTHGLEPGARVVRPADATPKPLKDGQRVRTGERGEAS